MIARRRQTYKRLDCREGQVAVSWLGSSTSVAGLRLTTPLPPHARPHVPVTCLEAANGMHGGTQIVTGIHRN